MRRVEVVDYSPEWVQQFEMLAERVKNVLKNNALRIEHVGSTSVPGLAAKGIIDMDIVIESWDRLETVIKQLETLGYHPRGNLDVEGREAFGYDDETLPVHHLYVCALDSPELKRHTFFRDYLRSHDEARDDYAALKKELAPRFRYDVDGYCEAKTEFIENILKKQES